MGFFKRDINVGDDAIVINHRLLALTVPYSEIEHTDLVEAHTFSIGQLVSGEKDDKICVGQFVNSSFGNYTLYGHMDVEKFIVVTYGGGKTLVFNMKKESATEKAAARIGAGEE